MLCSLRFAHLHPHLLKRLYPLNPFFSPMLRTFAFTQMCLSETSFASASNNNTATTCNLTCCSIISFRTKSSAFSATTMFWCEIACVHHESLASVGNHMTFSLQTMSRSSFMAAVHRSSAPTHARMLTVSHIELLFHLIAAPGNLPQNSV